MAIARSRQKAFDSIWRKDLSGQSGPAPADLLYLTSDLRSGSGTGLIADLLARPIAQRKSERVCVLGNPVFTELLSTWYRYSEHLHAGWMTC